MHRNYKNPTPKPLNDVRAFRNQRRSDDEGLVAGEVVCKHRQQRLELAMGNILESQNVGCPRVVALAVVFGPSVSGFEVKENEKLGYEL
ncbi:hypothetical protein VNO78_07805 [Psophocarpus tetragonolobus]|uniref:Uncharacterized protein n=1 Tax=Psophocarpus tetragonolobus TaxID=3891 RepID=A0AAN9SUV1_PSOTE